MGVVGRVRNEDSVARLRAAHWVSYFEQILRASCPDTYVTGGVEVDWRTIGGGAAGHLGQAGKLAGEDTDKDQGEQVVAPPATGRRKYPRRHLLGCLLIEPPRRFGRCYLSSIQWQPTRKFSKSDWGLWLCGVGWQRRAGAGLME